MINIYPDTRTTSSEICINSALDKITINVHLGINDMFNCLNVLLREWERLRPEHKEIVSDFVDEFIIKIIDDSI